MVPKVMKENTLISNTTTDFLVIQSHSIDYEWGRLKTVAEEVEPKTILAFGFILERVMKSKRGGIYELEGSWESKDNSFFRC